MSIACAKLVDGSSIHCEPTGLLKQYGWLPGTWIKWVGATRTFTRGAVASCDRCGLTDFPFGFIVSGSDVLKNGFDVKYANDNDKDNIWTADAGQLLFGKNHNVDFELDNQKQLSKIGTGIIAVNINHEGVFKFYVYEKYNKTYRASSGGAGGLLNWAVTVGATSPLYVSSRGLLTCEKENVNSIAISRAVADIGTDDVGDFILTVGI